MKTGRLIATILIIASVAGCEKSDKTKETATQTIQTNESTVVPTPATPPAPTEAAASPKPAAIVRVAVAQGTEAEVPGALPEFRTYLVGLTADSGINIDAIPELSGVCSQLKQQISVPDMNAIMECHLRTDLPLAADNQPPPTLVSFIMQDSGLRGQNSIGLGLFFDGWHSLTTPQGSMGVVDFTSPSGKFPKFRVVALRPGVANEPVMESKSLLRADQGTMPASFEQSFAAHLTGLAPQAGFLHLRPYLRTVGPPADMIDALPMPYKAAAMVDPLGFTRLRQVILEAINAKESKRKELDHPMGLGYFPNPSTFDRRYLPAQAQTELAKWQSAKAALDGSIASDRNCLAMVPESLEDPKLVHVALMFVAGTPVQPGDRTELIRFTDGVTPMEGGR